MSLKKSNIRPRVSESSEELNFEDRKIDRRVSWGLMRIREYTSNIEDSEFSPVPSTVNRPKIPMIEPADLYTAPIESPATASNLIHSSTVMQAFQAERREDSMDMSEPLSPRSESPARFMKGMDLIQEFNKIGAEEIQQEAKYNPILTPVIEENDAMQICSTDDSNTLLSSSNPVQQCIPSTPSQIPLLRYTPNLSAKLTPNLSSIPDSSRNHYTSLIEKNKLTPLKPIVCNIFPSHRLTPSKRNLFSYSEETDLLKAEWENCNSIAREVEVHKEAVMGHYKLKQDEYSKRYRDFKDYCVDYVSERASITEQFPSKLTEETSIMEDWWFGECRWILLEEINGLRTFRYTCPVNSCFVKGSFYLKICAGSVSLYQESPSSHVLLSIFWDDFRCFLEDSLSQKPSGAILDLSSRSISSLLNLIESYEQLVRFATIDGVCSQSESVELTGHWGSAGWAVRLPYRNLDENGELCMYVIKQLTT